MSITQALTAICLRSLFLWFVCVSPINALEKTQTASLLFIDDSAFSGTSINVVAGSRQTLYSTAVKQYAAFYDVDGYLILATRNLGEDKWQLFPTSLTANLNDAHNTISLVVDGDGYLHLAWGHHNSTLQYARSVRPHAPKKMVGRGMNKELESSVSYPQFFSLPNGDLLFAYRSGGSGRGNLVLKHYDLQTNKWSTRQRNLIDGENRRSAYWDMFLDTNAILHLAWNWRETPDVMSNHDLYYARSRDFGKSWADSADKLQRPPFRLENAERAARIPERHNLMNPPQVSADRASRPYIASYWSPRIGDKPQFQVLRKTGDAWLNIGGPASTEHFHLSGMGTKSPPVSRAILFVESNECASQPHLIYRDSALDGRIFIATYSDDQEGWQQRTLHDEDTGAWEPSMDPAQWQHVSQIHMLVQNVNQQDGNDQTSIKQSSSIYSLAWKVDSITECKAIH